MAKKMVYFFGGGKAQGKAAMKATLGGKGANLAEMTNLGIPVPAGFTITTDTCAAYSASKGKWPVGLKKEVQDNLVKLVQQAISKLATLNIKKCHIFIFNDNQNAKNFWKNILWNQRHDLIIMSKYIDTLA